MGQPLQDVWPVLFGSLSTTFESAKTDAVFGDRRISLVQDGFVEETLWRASMF